MGECFIFCLKLVLKKKNTFSNRQHTNFINVIGLNKNRERRRLLYFISSNISWRGRLVLEISYTVWWEIIMFLLDSYSIQWWLGFFKKTN